MPKHTITSDLLIYQLETPSGYGDEENELLFIRKQVVELFKGKISVPIEISTEESEEDKKEFLKLTKDFLSKDKPLKVIVSKDETEE